MRQRLQSLFARDGGLGAALGFVGQVEIFELAFVETLFDARFQLIGQLALLFDGVQDGFAARDQIAEVGELLFDFADFHFVEIAGGFLAVARDEGHGAAAIQQLDDRDQAAQGNVDASAKCAAEFPGRELFNSDMASDQF